MSRMIVCACCTKKLTNIYKYCDKCGTKVVNTERKCSRCKMGAHDDDAKYCWRCGAITSEVSDAIR